uniref:Uncharacterized protein n=1 Tax=Rhizophora mucronata TaxID=61149 RepID=A0A2P2R0D0_RHIMU
MQKNINSLFVSTFANFMSNGSNSPSNSKRYQN